MSRALFLAFVLLSTPASASPLNPWGVTVGEGVFALTPFLYVDQTPAVYPLVYGQYGLSDSFEILAGAGATVGGGFSFDSIELMPRYFFTESSGAALHLTWAPGAKDVNVAPEYHAVYSMEALDLTVNVGWDPSLGGSGFDTGSVYAIIAPEYYLTETTSLFLEINPLFDLQDEYLSAGDRFYLELVPGVSTSFAETHYIAAGVGIPITGFDPSFIYAGAWYSIAFGGA